MTDAQLYPAVGLPMVWNGILMTVLILYINGQTSKISEIVTARFEVVYHRLASLEEKIRHLEEK